MNISLLAIRNIILAVVVLIAVIVFIIFFFPKTDLVQNIFPKLIQNNTEQPSSQSQNQAKPTGKIVLSLVSKDSERMIPSPYIYDVEANTLTLADLDVFNGSLRTYVSDLKLSPNGAWAAFKGFKPSDVPSENWQDWTYSIYPQIHRSSLISANLNSATDKLRELRDVSTKLTNITSDHKQLSSINNLGSILFTTANSGEGSAEIQSAENFTINHITSDGTVAELTKGFAPKWVNDDYFIFLKNDGVYSYSINYKTEKLVYTLNMGEDPVKSNFKLNVSKDGRFVAIPFPGLGRTFILGLQHVPEPTLNGMEMYVEIDGFWPTFSPDGEFLVVQGVDAKNITNDPKPYLNIWRTSDLSKVDINVDLDAYRQEAMFIDDWIQ